MIDLICGVKFFCVYMVFEGGVSYFIVVVLLVWICLLLLVVLSCMLVLE